MKVLIIGAGIGGLSLAAFLEKENISYKIIEKQKDFSHHGYSLGMWSNGRHMLSKLGLLDEFDAHGRMMKFFKICDGTGKVLFDYNLSSISNQYGGYLHIHRSELVDWLVSRVDSQKIYFNTSVTNISSKEGSVDVTYADGSTENFDLVVGADGVSSKTRELVFGNQYRTFNNWRAWYVWINKGVAFEHTVVNYVEKDLYVVTFDEGEMGLAVLVARVDHSIWDKEEGRIEYLKKLFKSENIIPKILTNQKDTDLLPTDLSEVHMKNIYKGRVVLLGDSAHGFQPFAGIGGSMALEDSYVLFSELLKGKSIDRALSEYQKKRKHRVEQARKITRRMMHWATVKNGFLRSLINILLPHVSSRIFVKSYAKLFTEEI